MQKIAGYTNHWSYQSGPNNPDGGFSDAQWATIVREARAIVAAAEEKGIEIAGGQRSGRPVINDEMILLNGAGRQGHESFYLPKTPSEEDRRFYMQFMESFGEQPGQEVARGFCKTNGKPYDAVVASILAVAKRVGKGVFKATTDNGAVKRVFASSLAEGLEDACWEGYKAVGMKEQDGGQVPNCVPTKMAAHRLDGVRGHQLLPSTLARKLPAIYSQENVDDPLVQVKLFSPYTGAVWYLTEYDPASNEAFGWADLGYGMGELGYIPIDDLEGLNRNGLPLVERDTSWRPVPLSRAKGGRTAASASKYPSVARQVEEDYRRKAITQGERREMLEAIERAESRRDAERVVEQARKGRTATNTRNWTPEQRLISALGSVADAVQQAGLIAREAPHAAQSADRAIKLLEAGEQVLGRDVARDMSLPAYRTAASNRVAYEPPFHNAAKADEALGEAYRALINLKLGFDSWDEIPSSAHPLYQQIMKAVDAVVTARQVTTQVRAMVARKRY